MDAARFIHIDVPMVFSKTHAYSSNINTDTAGRPSDVRRVLNCSRGDNWSWLEDGFCAPSLEATESMPILEETGFDPGEGMSYTSIVPLERCYCPFFPGPAGSSRKPLLGE